MYLGLDLGAGSLKAVLVSEAGQIEASVSSPYAVSYPHSDWAESEARDWVCRSPACLPRLARCPHCCVGQAISPSAEHDATQRRFERWKSLQLSLQPWWRCE